MKIPKTVKWAQKAYPENMAFFLTILLHMIDITPVLVLF